MGRENTRNVEKGMTNKSAVAEHVWENHYPTAWEAVVLLARRFYPYEWEGKGGMSTDCSQVFVSP